MKLLVLIFSPLFRHIVSNLGFRSVLPNRGNRGAIGPELATPQLLFDRGNTLKHFPCGQALYHPCHFCRAVHGNRLDQKMAMITVGSNFKKSDRVAVCNRQTHIPNHRIDGGSHHGSPVFGGPDTVLDQNRDSVHWMEWFAHSCIVPDVWSASATPAFVSPPRRGNKPAFLPAARYGVSIGQSTWKRSYDRRAGIEGTRSQGIRAFELRQARYRGQAKTHLRHMITAVAMNIVRIMAWLQGRPHAPTRQSPFAALRPAGKTFANSIHSYSQANIEG